MIYIGDYQLKDGEVLIESEDIGSYFLDETKIDIGNGYGFSISFDSRSNYVTALKNDPYFKVLNHPNPGKASKQCRIAFRSAKYIVHSGTKGRGVKGAGTLPHCELDSKTKSDLIEYLKTGGWIEILEKFNSVMRQLLGDSSYNFYCEMPDYSTLSCDPKFKKR